MFRTFTKGASPNDGFSLLELACAVVVLGILATLALPWFGQMRAKAETLKCAKNLKGLGGGAAAYLDEHQQWPQIATESGAPAPQAASSPDSPAAQWIAALAPYGVSPGMWRCPSTERQMKNKGTPQALKFTRIDYSPTRFAPTPIAPWEFPTHPWFVERGSLGHGKGPLIYLTDGRVVTFEDLFKAASP